MIYIFMNTLHSTPAAKTKGSTVNYAPLFPLRESTRNREYRRPSMMMVNGE